MKERGGSRSCLDGNGSGESGRGETAEMYEERVDERALVAGGDTGDFSEAPPPAKSRLNLGVVGGIDSSDRE
jgi:hypothetical protein